MVIERSVSEAFAKRGAVQLLNRLALTTAL